MVSKELTKDQRNQVLYHNIDPGFINYRLCFKIMTPNFREFYNLNKKEEKDHWDRLYNHYLMVDIILKLCKNIKTPTLCEALSEGAEEGLLFCSTENFKGAGNKVYDKDIRVRNQVKLPFRYKKKVFADFSTSHFVADTGKAEQSDKCTISVIGNNRKIDEKEIVFYPIIMGAPSFVHHNNNNKGIDASQLMWEGQDFYEIYPDDIDEFSKMKTEDIPDEEWLEYMENISEKDVKAKLCKILKEIPTKDWGGELNDLFASDIHQSGRRTTAAFVLKGPTRFSEMKLSHLGKNHDQIFRLSQSPARLLIVQHSHKIGEAVRATLREFAVNIVNPKHYCLIDGRDTYRIFKAYDLL